MLLLTYIFLYLLNYSVLRASTGSFFAASFAGIRPAITVKNTLIPTSIAPPTNGSEAIFETSATFFIIMFAGIHKIRQLILRLRFLH